MLLFQISAASFQSPPTFSHTTTYLPATSCGIEPLVFRLKVPISRAEFNFLVHTGGTTVHFVLYPEFKGGQL